MEPKIASLKNSYDPQNGGAIAVIGATSIGLLDGDYLLNIELLDVIFSGHTQNIGAIFAQAKTQFLINSPRIPRFG